MRTIGNHVPRSFKSGDYPCLCDYCGVPWYRSELRKDGAGKLYCPQEGEGLDAQTLLEIEASEQLQEERQLEPRDGSFAKLPEQPPADLLSTIVGSGGPS